MGLAQAGCEVWKAMPGREFFKTLSYSAMHLAVAVGVAWALTRDWRIALGVGLIEPMVQTIAYAVHERVWRRIGRRRDVAPV